jgi:GR25 family glycosyltransferase involved in LPS biosynthesis
MYIVYNVENNLPNSHFLYLEDDTRFNEGWKEIVEQAMREIPSDFDFLFIGSCCAEHKERIKVGFHLYHFPNTQKQYAEYPLCGNAYIVAKKALPKILETQRDAYVNADINLAVNTFNDLKVYAILPRVCEQLNNEHLDK